VQIALMPYEFADGSVIPAARFMTIAQYQPTDKDVQSAQSMLIE
jgi:hypothetical protein